jgi:hypothetical protein
MMADAGRRDHFIDDGKIALAESLVEELSDNGTFLNGRRRNAPFASCLEDCTRPFWHNGAE